MRVTSQSVTGQKQTFCDVPVFRREMQIISVRTAFEMAKKFGPWSFQSGIVIGFLLCITLWKKELTTVESRGIFVPVFFVPVFLVIFLLFCAVLLEKYNDTLRKSSLESGTENAPVLTSFYMLVRIIFVFSYFLVGWIGGVTGSLFYLR